MRAKAKDEELEVIDIANRDHITSLYMATVFGTKQVLILNGKYYDHIATDLEITDCLGDARVKCTIKNAAREYDDEKPADLTFVMDIDKAREIQVHPINQSVLESLIREKYWSGSLKHAVENGIARGFFLDSLGEFPTFKGMRDLEDYTGKPIYIHDLVQNEGGLRGSIRFKMDGSHIYYSCTDEEAANIIIVNPSVKAL